MNLETIDIKQPLTSEQDAIEALTHFMTPEELGGFSFTREGTTYVFCGDLLPEEYLPSGNLFHVIVPEPNETARRELQFPFLGVVDSIRAFTLASLNVSTSLDLKPVTQGDGTVGWIFKGSETGIVLPVGYPSTVGWTTRHSEIFLHKIIPFILESFNDHFPVWEGDPKAALKTFYEKSLKEEAARVVVQKEATATSITQYEDRLQKEQEKLTTYDKVLSDIQGKTKQGNPWVKSQHEMLRALTTIKEMRASEDGKRLGIWTQSFTYQMGEYEYLFGEYLISVGVTGQGCLPNVLIKVTNLTRGSNTFQHPHSDSDGKWCWSSTAQFVEQAWNAGDLSGAIGMLLAFLQGVTIQDSYAEHLAYFPRRQSGATEFLNPDNKWEDVHNTIRDIRRDDD